MCSETLDPYNKELRINPYSYIFSKIYSNSKQPENRTHQILLINFIKKQPGTLGSVKKMSTFFFNFWSQKWLLIIFIHGIYPYFFKGKHCALIVVNFKYTSWLWFNLNNTIILKNLWTNPIKECIQDFPIQQQQKPQQRHKHV